MKGVSIFMCLVVAAFGMTPEVQEKIKSHLKMVAGECKAETPGLTDDDLAYMKEHHEPKSHSAKCFIACFHKKFGMITPEGKFDKDRSYALIEEMKPLDEEMYTKMKQVADACFPTIKEAADPCETAALIAECYRKQDEIVGLKRMCALE